MPQVCLCKTFNRKIRISPKTNKTQIHKDLRPEVHLISWEQNKLDQVWAKNLKFKILLKLNKEDVLQRT